MLILVSVVRSGNYYLFETDSEEEEEEEEKKEEDLPKKSAFQVSYMTHFSNFLYVVCLYVFNLPCIY